MLSAVLAEEPTPEIRTANLGDSGFVLVRRKGKRHEVVGRSTVQQHEFNFP